MKCTNCGVEVQGNFCTKCGSKLIDENREDKTLCPKCGSEVEGKFCGKCGFDLQTEKKDKVKTCSNCGHEVTGAFCSNCGTPVDKNINHTNSSNSNVINLKIKKPSFNRLTSFVKSHKKVVAGVVSLIIVLAVVYGLNATRTVKFTNINYNGEYSAILKHDGEEVPLTVKVNGGEMKIHTTGTTKKGKYKYDKEYDCIDMNVKTYSGKEQFILEKKGKNYYLTLYANSWGEYTIRISKGGEPIVNKV